MVDVSEKSATRRDRRRLRRYEQGDTRADPVGQHKKGDSLGTALIAGITAARCAHELIPLCHPLALSKVTLDIASAKKLPGCVVRATVKVTGGSPVTPPLPSWSDESKLAFDLREAVLD